MCTNGRHECWHITGPGVSGVGGCVCPEYSPWRDQTRGKARWARRQPDSRGYRPGRAIHQAGCRFVGTLPNSGVVLERGGGTRWLAGVST